MHEAGSASHRGASSQVCPERRVQSAARKKLALPADVDLKREADGQVICCRGRNSHLMCAKEDNCASLFAVERFRPTFFPCCMGIFVVKVLFLCLTTDPKDVWPAVSSSSHDQDAFALSILIPHLSSNSFFFFASMTTDPKTF